MPAVSPQEVALAIVPKVTGGLSMLGSGYIAYEVLSNPIKRQKTYHRLVALMSLVDVLSSFCYFLSTWPMPPGENKSWKSPEHFLAAGNDATCTAQGFGIQFGVTTAFFNIALSIHYLLVIKFRHTEASVRRLEPYMLGIPLAVGLALSVPGLFLDTYSNSNLWCWIANNWDLCALQGLSREQCMERTANYRWGFYFYPLWACLGFIVMAQLWLWWTVRQLESRASQWRSSDARLVRMKQSRRVAVQATWYVTGFIVTWVPYTALSLTNKVTKKFFGPHDATGFAVLLMVVICQPIQGFINLFIYHRASIARNTAKVATKLAESRMSLTNNVSRRSRAPSTRMQKFVSSLQEETLAHLGGDISSEVEEGQQKQQDKMKPRPGLDDAPEDTAESSSSVARDVPSAVTADENDDPEQQLPPQHKAAALVEDHDELSSSSSSSSSSSCSTGNNKPVETDEATKGTQRTSQVKFDVLDDQKDSWAELAFEDEVDDWGMADLDEIYG